ncbi:MAG: DUF1311 domain-containing protein [Proteobacteria bacterium]|nr:DUF1311 domain-containing protein [Pseudomonadota bacterium]
MRPHHLNHHLVAIGLVVTTIFAAPAWAQTQSEMNGQAGRGLREAEEQLRRFYTRLETKYAAETMAGFRETQEAWLHFREIECAFETRDTVGGSIHPMLVDQCKTRMTLQRVKDLELLSNCQEGHLGCPVR